MSRDLQLPIRVLYFMTALLLSSSLKFVPKQSQNFKFKAIASFGQQFLSFVANFFSKKRSPPWWRNMYCSYSWSLLLSLLSSLLLLSLSLSLSWSSSSSWLTFSAENILFWNSFSQKNPNCSPRLIHNQCDQICRKFATLLKVTRYWEIIYLLLGIIFNPNLLCCWANNFPCCKWPKMNKKPFDHLVTLKSQ